MRSCRPHHTNAPGLASTVKMMKQISAIDVTGRPAEVQAKPANTFGIRLHAYGQRLVGKTVNRYWPKYGGWQQAVVTAFLAKTGEHRYVLCLHQMYCSISKAVTLIIEHQLYLQVQSSEIMTLSKLG